MEFRAKAVSWDDIERWCDEVRKQIVNTFSPDLIIGLSRGGLVPARILSDSLWIKDLLSIKTEHWGITATQDGKAVLRDPGVLNIKGKRVLIVDDITDTGQSMKLAHEFVRKQNPAEVKTATMLHITRSSFVPDFYGEEITEKNWAWFIFPWNVYEDVDNLLSRVLRKESSLEQVTELLLENFELVIPQKHLKKVLDDFVTAGKLVLKSGKFRLPEKAVVQ
ncbi:MAG: hypothetical protein AMDU1_APLC00032G0007 [Thermoplasmatales archaeon A-plasma]|jgi:hypoxanthine phosphoribosyltransferase|nr:MAG: hypothetical protein AMDU1_APLC00032G0007 [Thermoplasmatales archaeon A-plasma]MCL5732687.1 phosphoribosyltransferase [Candidatus Thermoplasmatota archaeon]